MRFKITKFQDGCLMHNLSPTLASVFCGQLLGIPISNPCHSFNHRRPPILSQHTECFSQGTHYIRGTPIYCDSWSNSVNQPV